MEKKNWSGYYDKVSKALSVLFHPLFVPLYGLLIIFFAPTLFWYLPLRVKEILFFTVLINNVLIPASLMPFFRYRNLIRTWIIGERKERSLPLFVVSVLYGITSMIYFRMELPLFLKAYIYSLTFLSAVLFIVNLFWKISLHSAASGMLVALVSILSVKMSVSLPLYMIISLVTGGIVLSSRLKLGAQTPAGVYAGFICGFTVTASLLLFFQ